eukprot:TRINITY_DN1323_c0_g1_i7.p1 TRINITY_DN1323_c0_g1~~TRINITY_DN1323_c0_g1_i7.p1  ORF type:complete len:606 (+),score=159.43 TRINITY_DN1323_c0_g1_i7:81-1820(+)
MASEDAKFVEWMQLNGFNLHPSIRCVHLPFQGRCVMAESEVKKGEVLFEIPHPMVLSPRTSDIAEKLSYSELNGWNALAVAMMREYILGVNSKWAPYLNILPRHFEMPLFWPPSLQPSPQSSSSTLTSSPLPSQRSELQGTGLAEQSQDMVDTWYQQYDQQVRPFVELHPDLFPSDQASFHVYQNMIAIIMSYSFTDVLNPNPDALNTNTTPQKKTRQVKTPEKESDEEDDEDEEEDEEEEAPTITILAPFADILNHNSRLNNARLHFAPDRLQMLAIRNISAGEQVYNTYGKLSNSELLLKYGFVNQDNSVLDEIRFDLRGDVIEVCKQLRPTLNEKKIDTALERLDESDVFEPITAEDGDEEEEEEEKKVEEMEKEPQERAAPSRFENGGFVVASHARIPPALLTTLHMFLTGAYRGYECALPALEGEEEQALPLHPLVWLALLRLTVKKLAALSGVASEEKFSETVHEWSSMASVNLELLQAIPPRLEADLSSLRQQRQQLQLRLHAMAESDSDGAAVFRSLAALTVRVGQHSVLLKCLQHVLDLHNRVEEEKPKKRKEGEGAKQNAKRTKSSAKK